MQGSFTKNYIKIYFWQVISLLLGLASVFVVVPFLSKEPAIYGIYTICISVVIFLSYADLGFVGAGQKYAAECYARGERGEELKIIGFSGFILLVFSILCSFLFAWLSFKPELLVSNIKTEEQKVIASELFLILTFAAPFIASIRILQMLYAIRLEEYILQRIIIVGNIIKLLSALYFFREGHYDVVGYFFFVQIVPVLVWVTGLLVACRRYQYKVSSVFKSLSFNKEIFIKTKSLAISSLVVTLSWIAYFELDSMVIGKLIGAEEVALFAIGFTLLTYFRSFFGILFSPFSARFNHFVGEKKDNDLRNFFLHINKLTFSLTVFPIVIFVCLAHPFVIAWVGEQYEESVNVARWLVLCNIYAFIAYPAGLLLIAKERIKAIYYIAIICPVIYWGGILGTYAWGGITSFALFKFVIFTLMAIIYLYLSKKILGIKILTIWKQVVAPYIPALCVIVLLAININSLLLVEGKSKIELFKIIGIFIGLFVMAMGINLVFVPALRNYIRKVVKSF